MAMNSISWDATPMMVISSHIHWSIPNISLHLIPIKVKCVPPLENTIALAYLQGFLVQSREWYHILIMVVSALLVCNGKSMEVLSYFN